MWPPQNPEFWEPEITQLTSLCNSVFTVHTEKLCPKGSPVFQPSDSLNQGAAKYKSFYIVEVWWKLWTIIGKNERWPLIKWKVELELIWGNLELNYLGE